MTRLKLREYQVECVAAHWSALAVTGSNPLFVVPTGGGKSLIIAEFIEQTLRAWPETQILMLTHVKELIQQNHDELIGQWSGGLCPVGIYSAGLGRREHDQRITFAGIQSAAHRDEMHRHFDLVLIDEAHLVPKEGQGRYRTYLEELSAINPKLRVCGYTATHYRLDGGYLHKGEGAIFTDVAYTVPVKLLISEGYLCNVRSKRPDNQISTVGLHSRQGDYIVSEMAEAAMGAGIVGAAVDEAVAIASKEQRKSWLVFAITIEHAEQIIHELKRHGVQAEAIFGHTDKTERRERAERFRSGGLQCLVNVGCLTTGFNAPRCDLGIIMRPTQSIALYVQMVGRIMRTFPGKKDALLLDYGTNVERHGPIDSIEIDDKKDKAEAGDAPVKTCPECKEYVPLAVSVCPECGFEFPGKDRREHDKNASTADPISWRAPAPPKKQAVHGMHLRRWRKHGGTDSLRVDYVVGVGMTSEWVCLEHSGYAHRKACEWWLKMGGSTPFPTIAEALERADELSGPSHITVIKEGKYDRIAAMMFERDPVYDIKTEVQIDLEMDTDYVRDHGISMGELPF